MLCIDGPGDLEADPHRTLGHLPVRLPFTADAMQETGAQRVPSGRTQEPIDHRAVHQLVMAATDD
jgi:hypothetical protein